MEDTLHQKFSHATSAECKRFLRAYGSTDNMKGSAKDRNFEQAAILLQGYLDWRARHELDGDDDASNDEDGNALNSDYEDVSDDKDWKYAVTKALKASIPPDNEADNNVETSSDELSKDNQKPSVSTKSLTTQSSSESQSTAGKPYIPQWVFVHQHGDNNADANPSNGNEETERSSSRTNGYLSDKNGKTILHVLPARVDKELVSSETHSLVVAFYLNRKLDRNSEETMTVFIDTRPGEGWPNPSALSLLGFIRNISNKLQSLYPERLENLILMPIPYIAMYLWSAVKSFLFKRTIDRVVVAPGSAGKESPIPKDYLMQHVDDSVLERLEIARLDTFVSFNSTSGSDDEKY